MSPEERKITFSRLAQVALRSLHIAAMGMVLGGLWLGGGFERLRTAILLTVARACCWRSSTWPRGQGACARAAARRCC